jgi:hypothetical protein
MNKYILITSVTLLLIAIINIALTAESNDNSNVFKASEHVKPPHHKHKHKHNRTSHNHQHHHHNHTKGHKKRLAHRFVAF